MDVQPNRVLETTTTTGTGTITVGGAVAGYSTFALRVAVGDTFPYYIEAVDGNGNPTGAYENGTGTLVTSTTFSRAVESSSNSDALVSFSAGTKYCSIGVLTSRIVTIGQTMAIAAGAYF